MSRGYREEEVAVAVAVAVGITGRVAEAAEAAADEEVREGRSNTDSLPGLSSKRDGWEKGLSLKK